ncbi:hypothetical protein [Halomonas sp. 3H]|uniref:hypothetical protein n=1 Tax=Halomonas sp. 3H TaxID=2952527 RepID=UPI0020B79287|nr:hypothetical protein [Halomonas sp. 3H]
MNISTVAVELAEELVDQLLPPADMPPACFGFNPQLGRRLAEAKTRLDRLERDATSRDLAALEAARVEFALASRAIADELIASGLHAGAGND